MPLTNFNEWSLEMNVVTEIKEVSGSIWWYLRPSSLNNYWTPGLYFPFLRKPKFALYKPAPRAENNLGFDIELAPLHEGSKGLFLQFKRPDFGEGEENEDSEFYTNNGNFPPYYVFEINNNNNHDQHLSLRNLTNEPGAERTVLYSLPRIADSDELHQYIGSLLLRTSFLSIPEIDEQADIRAEEDDEEFDWDTSHRLLIADDGNHWELNYYYYKLNLRDYTADLFSDLVILNLDRCLRKLRDVNDRNTEFIGIAVTNYLLNLLYYLGVKFEDAVPYLELLMRKQTGSSDYLGVILRWVARHNERIQSLGQNVEKGTRIWMNISQQLNLIEVELEENPFDLLYGTGEYKYKTLFDIPEKTIITTEKSTDKESDDSLTDLSIYIF